MPCTSAVVRKGTRTRTQPRCRTCAARPAPGFPTPARAALAATCFDEHGHQHQLPHRLAVPDHHRRRGRDEVRVHLHKALQLAEGWGGAWPHRCEEGAIQPAVIGEPREPCWLVLWCVARCVARRHTQQKAHPNKHSPMLEAVAAIHPPRVHALPVREHAQGRAAVCAAKGWHAGAQGVTDGPRRMRQGSRLRRALGGSNATTAATLRPLRGPRGKCTHLRRARARR
jgi:hypothetical protein